ncbi:MAG: hypothetical protein RDU24_13780 [Humidesulfovibrio sp.]|uniref:hypothetical protein n=1 Tax=Humidesulfovibrio sp. TaxID=2910988 RepID=UPI0027EE5895|nr:hypothetical protein [Humidesulfovibrio sp.]MDQ7836446.1 hypothetical protein [Humidesulfovibrio sp.]
MFVRFALMAGVRVVVVGELRHLFVAVFQVVALMPVQMQVHVGVLVAVGVGVRVGVRRAAGMGVAVLVFVGVLMGMLVHMLQAGLKVVLHGRAPCGVWKTRCRLTSPVKISPPRPAA